VRVSARFLVTLAHKDLTNMWKAAEDGLKQVAFLDDDRVYEAHLIKEAVASRAEEGIEFSVAPWDGPAFDRHR